mgnify:CR=1 FL=1
MCNERIFKFVYMCVMDADKNSDAGKVGLLNMMAALALALGICSVGIVLAGGWGKILGFQGAAGSLGLGCIIITTLVMVVLLAPIFPSSLRPLASSGETLGIMFIQVNKSIFLNSLRVS